MNRPNVSEFTPEQQQAIKQAMEARLTEKRAANKRAEKEANETREQEQVEKERARAQEQNPRGRDDLVTDHHVCGEVRESTWAAATATAAALGGDSYTGMHDMCDPEYV